MINPTIFDLIHFLNISSMTNGYEKLFDKQKVFVIRQQHFSSELENICQYLLKEKSNPVVLPTDLSHADFRMIVNAAIQRHIKHLNVYHKTSQVFEIIRPFIKTHYGL